MDKKVRKRDGPAPPADLFPEVAPEETGFIKKPKQGRSDPGLRDDWRPKIDIAETRKEYVIFVEVPGVKSDGVSVDAAGNVLSIFIKKNMIANADRYRFHKVERDFGTSFRSFEIPDDALGLAPRWRIRGGVLIIRLDRHPGVLAPEIGTDAVFLEGERDLPDAVDPENKRPIGKKKSRTVKTTSQRS